MYRNDRGGGFRPQGNFAPVKVGEELDVKIEAVGEKGDGIAKKGGFVLFVPGTKEGDEVRIRVTKVLRKVGFAEVVGTGGSAPAEKASEPAEDEAEDYDDTQDSEDFGEDDSEPDEAEEDSNEETEEGPEKDEEKN